LADREHLRRRVLAFAGIWFLVAGMLAALGIGIVLFASLAVLLVGAAVAGGIALLGRHDIGHKLPAARESAGRASRRIGHRLPAARQSAERASRRLKARLDDQDLPQRVQRSAALASHRARAFVAVPKAKPAEIDEDRRARQLNQRGAQLRREGEYEQAAEQHRAALAIVRELGDRRVEALTLNNLALALVHTRGGVPAAVEHFEQALALLAELGDEEREGQVIANLAFVRRRQGRDEDADNLLSAALDKLPPESSAYRQVEDQLQRAS
jgi:tetratricopeptide (TPR) repeat protein